MPSINLSRRAALAVAAVFAAAPALAQQRTAPEPGRTYRIGYAQIVDHPALNATRQGFIDALKAAGFEVGKNLVFDYQNAQGNPGAARNIIEKFIADKVDLLAPCTTAASWPKTTERPPVRRTMPTNKRIKKAGRGIRNGRGDWT